MRDSVTQEFDYGCGIACYAFALRLTYREAAKRLGSIQAQSDRFWVKDLVVALNSSGGKYVARHVKIPPISSSYHEGTIVLIRRSKRYPTGHYLVRHNDCWMDPWINLSFDKRIENAKSGFRKRLPGTPMYTITPLGD